MIRVVIATAAAALLLGCGFNKGVQDVLDKGVAADEDVPSEPAEDVPSEPPEDVADAPVDTAEADVPPVAANPAVKIGCEWIAGEWDLVDCEANAVVIRFIPQDSCLFILDATSPLLVGATAQVTDAAVGISLQSGGSCHGFFDGQTIHGACTSLTGLCAFIAAPKLSE